VLALAIVHIATLALADGTTLRSADKLGAIITITDPKFAGGAKCDGSTNDTSAIQAAIDAVDSTVGGTVMFPRGAGDCVSGNLLISDKTGLTLLGSGGQVRWTGAAPSDRRIGFQLSGTLVDLRIEGLRVKGDGAVANGHAGVWGLSGATLRNIQILNNVIRDVVVGISLNTNLAGSIRGALIQGNQLENIVGTSIGHGYGIHYADGSGLPSDVRIIGNQIRKAQRHSIYHARGAGNVIAGNTIMQHRLGVANGTFRPALQVGRSVDVVVQENIVALHGDGGIYIFKEAGSATRNIVVRGNIAIHPSNTVSSYIVGSINPANDGFPENIRIDGNVGYQIGVNSPVLRIENAKRLLVADNLFQNLGVTAGSIGIVQIRGTGEGAGTAQFSDEFEFRNNLLSGTLNGGAAVAAFASLGAQDTSAVRMTFAGNDVKVPGDAFLREMRITNPNIAVFDRSDKGLGVYTRRSERGQGVAVNGIQKPVQVALAQITHDQNNYSPSTISSFLRVTTDAPRMITGVADGANRRILFLVNSGSNELALANDDQRSDARNRIITGTGVAVTLRSNGTAILVYDMTDSRWHVLNLH
jgi:hypothetical protein